VVLPEERRGEIAVLIVRCCTRLTVYLETSLDGLFRMAAHSSSDDE
jgi:hypothetical protein